MINKWKEEYSVGDPILDSHHQHLFDLILKSKSLLTDTPSQEELLNVIKELKDYTLYHFNEEEKRMVEHKYIGYSRQKDLHNLFIEEIVKLENKIIHHDSFVTDDLFLFLSQWLVNHIQNEDMKYKNKI